MKNALVITFLLCCFTALAQKNTFEYGVQGGINVNSLYGTSVMRNVKGNTTGLSIGANAKWNKTDWFGIRVQLSYEQMGYSLRNLYLEDSVNGLAKADIRFKLNYLNLPVFAEFTFGKKVKFMIDAGGFVGVLLTDKAVVNRVLPDGSQRFWYSINTNDVKRLNAGLAAGVGVQVPLTSKIALAFNARNYTGLINTSKSSASFNSSQKTMTFTFLGGLTFRL